jgi:hypothetical protein
MRECKEELAKVVDERWKEKGINADGSANTKRPNAPFRAEVAREIFAEMTPEDREGYQRRAVEEAAAARAEYKKEMEKGPSNDPEARQRYVKCYELYRIF